MTDYDVIIVGGGMVGATMACALASSTLKIALIQADAIPAVTNETAMGIRVSALTIASQRILQNLGVWSHCLRVSPFHGMQVWDASGDGEIQFSSFDLGYPHLGHIVENQVVQAALWQRIQDFNKITTYCPAKVQQLYFTDKAYITLEDGSELSAQLVIGADGGRSMIRESANIKTHGWSYQQQAVVAQVTPEHSHQQTAWQRFDLDGPLAFLPLANGDCSIVWSTTPERAQDLLGLSSAAFASELESAFAARLGRITQVQQRAAFPLYLQHAEEYVQARLALIGDACHVIHPLAGQGVNLGLLDAASLAQIVLQTWQQGRDIGRLNHLQRYERWRKGQNLLMMALMDGFKHLFGNPFEAIRWIRNMGLNQTNQATLIKQHIIQQAMGLRGDLPKLAQMTEETKLNEYL